MGSVDVPELSIRAHLFLLFDTCFTASFSYATPFYPHHVTLADTQEHWFVMRSQTDQLRMEDYLRSNGFEVFVPKVERAYKTARGVVKKWVPAVTVYVFVRSDYSRLRDFKKDIPALRFARTLGSDTPHSTLKVPDKEMDDFIRVASERAESTRLFRPDEVELSEGQRIRIVGGPLSGVEGVLAKVKGLRSRRMVLTLSGLVSVMTEVDKGLIQLLTD